jgi:hypothetical protein
MRKETVIVSVLFTLILASTTLAIISAAVWPSLPSSTVQLTAVYGTNSYFDITLSAVPNGYDVHNGVYPGWCVEDWKVMDRGVSHIVKLYSSLTPPQSLTNVDWTAINYIINHKLGTRMDVQNAIWHFSDGLQVSGNALTMVNEALAHSSYDPSVAPILAVICLRQSDGNVQTTIIELTRSVAGLSPGFWKHNVKVYNGGPGSYSAPYDGMPHETDASMLGYAGVILANHGSEIPVSVTTPDGFLKWVNTQFQSPANNKMWLTYANWFNEAAGYQPYTDN